jgi:putative endonuclease
MYYVYIAMMESGRLYTGYTSNLAERIKRHGRKNPTRTTATDRIRRVVFYAAFDTKKTALDFEKYLKSSSGSAFRNKRLINPPS